MHSPTDTEVSSPTRRRRALADALFGEMGPNGGAESLETPRNGETDTLPSPSSQETPKAAGGSPVTYRTNLANPSLELPPSTSEVPPSDSSTVAPPSDGPVGYADHSELAKEVQRRTEAAMAQLRKIPSNSKMSESASSGQRKRITPNQISSPRLVSASTSVDTIPLRSPSAASGHAHNSSKFGQRIKKLRGTLRPKPVHLGSEEITPFPMDLLSPTSAQTIRYNPASLIPPGGPPAAVSATELGRFKVSVPSPPASAGPGLKGFIARFRKPRAMEASFEHDHRKVPLSSAAQSASVGQLQGVHDHDQPSAPSDGVFPSLGQAMAPSSASQLGPLSSTPAMTASSTVGETGRPPSDQAALKQLFDAASNLGLDQEALNDLLARSTSVSSRSTAANASRHASAAASQRSAWLDSSLLDRARSPAISEGRPSLEQSTSRQTPEPAIRQLSFRKQSGRRDETAPDRSASNAVLRRTLIFPSETRQSNFDLNALTRKNSASRRRRSASAASVLSTRSVHDRAPTPPPPKSPISQRFSTDTSPPVPQLPASFLSRGDNALAVSQPALLPLEKSNSAYDSL